MGIKYLSAYTTVEQYTDPTVGHQGPPYINFSEDTDRGVVIVRGREKAPAGQTYGRDFMVEIPKGEWAKMLIQAAGA